MCEMGSVGVSNGSVGRGVDGGVGLWVVRGQ